MSWRALMGVEDEHFESYPQKEQKEQKVLREGLFATIATIADKGQKLKIDDPEIRYQYEERAAIMQLEGGLSRGDWEILARDAGRNKT
ncbi:MAG: hypothetical protein K9M96_07885 [Deltaproteobacteria bacterium]|nr:hypothetical protein [Deltaproteobacteria bacterium]